MSQRVIGGSAKGRRLQMVPGDSTRPVTDRAKEALFSILGSWIEDARVLDLFGGTGAVGIEALSRGARFAHFLDLNRKAYETIRANLEHTRLAERAVVERGDSFRFLESYRGEPFHLIYVAPPQYHGMWSKALLLIDSRPELLAEFGTVIIQIHPREWQSVELQVLEEYDRRAYGSTRFVFFARSEDIEASDGVEEEDEEWYNEEGEDETSDELDDAGDADDGVADGLH